MVQFVEAAKRAIATNCLNTGKFAEVYRCLLGQANLVNKTVFRSGFKLLGLYKVE